MEIIARAAAPHPTIRRSKTRHQPVAGRWTKRSAAQGRKRNEFTCVFVANEWPRARAETLRARRRYMPNKKRQNVPRRATRENCTLCLFFYSIASARPTVYTSIYIWMVGGRQIENKRQMESIYINS